MINIQVVEPEEQAKPEQVKPDEPEAQESSEGSDFETINPSDVPELVEAVIPQEAAVEEVPVVEETPVVESTEEMETEEDLVKTIELGDRVDAALDDYLGRDEVDQIEPETEPVEEIGSKDIEVIELIEKKEEQIQESEIVIEPEIVPVDIQNIELETEKSDLEIEKSEEPESEQQIVQEDQIIPINLGDQTIMTPMAPKPDNSVEDIVEPIKLDLEESQVDPEPVDSEPIEDIERKIENVAEQLIADTLEQIKSNDNIITQVKYFFFFF